MNPSLPKVIVIGCGGTISSLACTTTDVLDYPETGRKMSAVETLERLQEVHAQAAVLPVEFRAVGSSAIGPPEWGDLAQLIGSLVEHHPDVSGFVILHGTASMEETAYALHLGLKTDRPVVFTGAQRPANTLSSDAAMNIIGAVRVAASEGVKGLGVLLALNDEIHSARDVTKSSTYRLHAFRSGDFGSLGQVDGDCIALYRRPTRKHTLETPFDLSSLIRAPRVDIAYSYAGADRVAIDAFVAAGAKGIVSAGLAPGLLTPDERKALEEAAERGIVVVQSTRAGTGRVARRNYLRNKRLVAADNLTPQKARILLTLGLTVSEDPDEIQEMFDLY